jgi:plastocyanin
MTPASTTTDADGIATSSWALGTVSGPQTAQATLNGASGSPVSFTATANSGLPTTLSDAGGNNQTGTINATLGQPVQAKVSDQFGNGVAGVEVAWQATGATVAAPVVPTDASGISGVDVTLGETPGPITITASEESLTGSPVIFTATATEEEPEPTTASVGVVNNSFTPSALTISAGTTVVWTWTSTAVNHNVVPAGTVPPSSGAPADGPRSYSFRFDTPGTYTYYCEVHGSPTTGMRGTITVQ